ncbi:hypothetical protein N2W54_006575 [Lotmaria passim]
MDRTPASHALHVYVSDVILLLATLVSLTFRAYRQGFDTISEIDDNNVGRSERINSSTVDVTSAHPLWADTQPRERGQLQRQRVAFSSPDVVPDTGDSSDGADSVAAAAEAVLPTNVAADPLLILAERLTLEEKLSTAVNWLSLVSNCLTYFLRPSQVLYTFLFTNGDFVLFVTSYSNRYQRLHPAAQLRFGPLPDASTAAAAVAAPAPASLVHGLGSKCGTNAHSVRSHHADGDAAAVCVPPPKRSPFPANVQAGPRYRESVSQHGLQRSTAGGATDMHSPSETKSQAFPLGRPIPQLRYCASRCIAFAQTQLSWLLFLNALLTSTLFVFHVHHLFFFLGTLFGYLAAIASVFLCGMEAGCVMVRLRRLQRRWRRGGARNNSDSEADQCDEDGVATLSTARDPRRSPLPTRSESGAGGDAADRDPSSGIDGPCWAFVGEHLSAAACSLLYIWMLLEEGDVLWSSHVNLMRWYVCSCALMLLSLLKCLRVVF